jgi:preprotein translocase subunit SecE
MAKAAVVETSEPSAIQRATAGPQRLIEFLKETRQEMTKVHTPSRAEVQAVDLVLGSGIDKMFMHLAKH